MQRNLFVYFQLQLLIQLDICGNSDSSFSMKSYAEPKLLSLLKWMGSTLLI